jgi:hypothetical protein
MSRSPRGVLSSKPVYMRLMPHEQHTLAQLSERQRRSMSSVARLVYLEGLDRYLEKSIAPGADASGADASDAATPQD